MRPDWINYPCGLFWGALKTTTGGFIVLILALSLGTQIGLLALDEFNRPYDTTECIVLVFSFIGPIAFACMQLWGFLYFVFIAWLLHLLIHQEVSALRIGAFAMFPQVTCTIVTFGSQTSFSWDEILRVLIVELLAALCSLSPYLIDKFKKNHPSIS